MSGKRRGSGEGSIYQRASDGRWIAAVDLGSVGGRRRRKTVYGKTRKEVAEKLKTLHRQQQQGQLRASDRTTVGAYLLDWLGRLNRRQSTIDQYRHIIEKHIIPRLGHIRLDRLTSDDIDALTDAIAATGHAPTAKQARQILNTACKDAMKRQPPLLLFNPVVGTNVPSVEAAPPRTLSDDQARWLIVAAEDERFGIAVLLGLLLGLRRGEITGLRWSDIDWRANTITIERTARRAGRKRTTNPPKSKKSNRVLPLVAILRAALQRHQTAQDEELRLKGIANVQNLIIVSEAGTMYDTANYLRQFRKIVRKAGLDPTLRPHDLRHSTASLLIGFGVDPRTVADVLGHASTRTTMEIYTRGQQTDRRGALDELERRLRDDEDK